MGQICHAHCPQGGGGFPWGAVILIAVVVGALSTRTAARVASDVLEVAEWTAISVASAAVLTAAVVVTVKVRRRQGARQLEQARARALAAQETRLLAGSSVWRLQPPPRVHDGLVDAKARVLRIGGVLIDDDREAAVRKEWKP